MYICDANRVGFDSNLGMYKVEDVYKVLDYCEEWEAAKYGREFVRG